MTHYLHELHDPRLGHESHPPPSHMARSLASLKCSHCKIYLSEQCSRSYLYFHRCSPGQNCLTPYCAQSLLQTALLYYRTEARGSNEGSNINIAALLRGYQKERRFLKLNWSPKRTVRFSRKHRRVQNSRLTLSLPFVSCN